MTKPAGYRHPPLHSRWRKGQSGNPSGRPKRPKRIEEDVLAEMSEKVTLTEGGRSKRITKQRALIKGHTARGIKGDTRSAKLILDILQRASGQQPEQGTSASLTPAETKILEDYLEEQVELRLAERLAQRLGRDP